MLAAKRRRLEEVLGALGGAIVAYSGGADSAFVAEVAHVVLGPRSLAITADSPSIPRRELAAAAELARQRGWNHELVRTNEIDDSRYAANPVNRCYYCKSALFEVLGPRARRSGVPILLGTNVDDLSDHRPGHIAADEHGVLHPLVEAGLSKAEVRALSREAGLPTWDKPAAACLASRFAYGVRVTTDGLRRVETSENFLFGRGYRVVRVRDLGGDKTRVEVGPDEIARLQTESDALKTTLESLGWAEVVIDERGYRRGSLNEGVVPVALMERPASG